MLLMKPAVLALTQVFAKLAELAVTRNTFSDTDNTNKLTSASCFARKTNTTELVRSGTNQVKQILRTTKVVRDF